MKKLCLLLGIITIQGYAITINTVTDGSVICAKDLTNQGLEVGVKWYRTAAEKNALYNQAYNDGTRYVKNWVSNNHPAKNSWGVILDIDETTLDNSWYFALCQTTLNNNGSDFDHYISNQKKSTALPGVVKFTHLVHDLGGYVTMLSNRDGAFQDSSGITLNSTISNLKSENVYFDNVVLANYKYAKDPLDKNPRFSAVVSGKYDLKEMVISNKLPAHKVIAYFGDNIQDFPGLKQSKIAKLDKNSSIYDKFGNGYFILPNPMYGSWDTNH